MRTKKLTIWLISVMGTFGVGDGVWLFFRGRAGGVMGCTLTLHSFEFRFGDILAGKLNVFVHCDKLRTIFDVDSFGSVIVKIRLFNSITRHNFNRSTSINQFNQISFVSIFHIQMYDLSIQQFVQFNRIFISQREFDLFTSDKIK